MNEWISVKVKLPEDVYGKHRKQMTVLVYTGSKNVIACSRVRSYKWNSTEMRYVETEKFEWNKASGITHWMKLPEPPKESDE